ncbi:hypothetical protein BSL78_25325, partial [Apostichopus japonicus]
MLSDADNMTALFKGMVGTMFIAIVALINLEGYSANTFYRQCSATKQATLGNPVQLDCNAANAGGRSWIKDKSILLFAETTSMREDGFGDIELIDDYSILISHTKREYEGVYTCLENGSVIKSYCLQIA